MVESVGKQLQQARLRKQISVEEAARVTRVRPDKILDLEADNYSNFPSMSYAKGFLVIYAKFLGVDVSDFADTMRAPNPVSSEDYEYLNAAAQLPAPAPTRRPYSHSFTPRRERSILPLIVLGVLIAVAFLGYYLFTVSQRLGGLDELSDKKEAAPAPAASASPAIPAIPAFAVAPPAMAPSAAPAPPAAAQSPAPAPPVVAARPTAPAPPVAAASPAAAPAPPSVKPPPPLVAFDPSLQVRRAEPVAERAAASPAAPAASQPAVSAVSPVPAMPSPSPAVVMKEVSVQPLRKTRVTIRRDMADSAPVFEDWLYPNDGPLKLRGGRFWIDVQDPGSVQVTENGKPVPSAGGQIQIE